MPQPYLLADVLCSTPPLLPMLSSEDWVALSHCSRHLQHMIHSSVTAITVPSVSHAEAVLAGSWPYLALIKIQPISYRAAFSQDLCLLQASNYQLIASLETSRSRYEESSIVILVRSLCHGDHNSIVVAFKYLQTPQMQQARHLRVIVHSHEVDVIAQLALSDWPSITDLMLSDNKLGHETMVHLAKGSWPKLDRLDLSSNQLDTAAVTALIQGNWPLLTDLVLEENSSLGPAALALISEAANWASLSMLSLKLIQLDSSCTLSIALLHNQLQELNLSRTGIDAAALSQLTHLPWPQLRVLCLDNNRLNAEAIASLVLAELPELLMLDLADNKLCGAAARHIGKSNWSSLFSLSLHNNRLDSTAMAFLAKGNWPILAELSLYGNEICDLGFELLMGGQWPELYCLTLGSRHITATIWTLLDLYQPMPHQKWLSCCFYRARDPSHSDFQRVAWPNLLAVIFMPDCNSTDVTSPGQVLNSQSEGVTKPVTSANTNRGVQCDNPASMAPDPISDNDSGNWLGLHWINLMVWSSLAFAGLWVFRHKYGRK